MQKKFIRKALEILGSKLCIWWFGMPQLIGFKISLGQDSTIFRGILDKMQSKGLGTRATLYVPWTVLEARGLHLIQRSRGKRWRLDIIPRFCRFRNRGIL